MYMSDPILSPDGKMMWSGTDWIPLAAQSTANVQDSLVMGDINTKIEHSVHNTYSEDTEKMVRNHLYLVAEKMGLGQFIQADEMYEKAKHIDYELATELYSGEFCGIFVAALWNELSSHPIDKFNSLTIHFIEDRVLRILAFDEEHVPSLLLLTKILLKWLTVDLFHTGYEKAEFNCRRVLSVEPGNEVALNGLRKIEFLNKCHVIKRVVLSLVGLFFVAVSIFL